MMEYVRSRKYATKYRCTHCRKKWWLKNVTPPCDCPDGCEARRLIDEAKRTADATLGPATVRAVRRTLLDVANLERMLECLGYGSLARRASEIAETLR